MFVKSMMLTLFLHIMGSEPVVTQVPVSSYEECIQKGLAMMEVPIDAKVPFSKGFACEEMNLLKA